MEEQDKRTNNVITDKEAYQRLVKIHAELVLRETMLERVVEGLLLTIAKVTD